MEQIPTAAESLTTALKVQESNFAITVSNIKHCAEKGNRYTYSETLLSDIEIAEFEGKGYTVTLSNTGNYHKIQW